MHLQLQADDLWRRDYKQLQFPTAGRFSQELQLSCTTASSRVSISSPSHPHIDFPQSQANPAANQSLGLSSTRSSPTPFFAQTQHGPRLRISSRLPFHEPAIAHACNLLRTRAIKTHRIRLINLNVWHATTHRKPTSHTTPAHRHTITHTRPHDEVLPAVR
jgi:hypothetical protein